MAKRSIPFYVGIALLITTISSLAYTVAMAQTSYTIPMPYISELLRGSSVLIGKGYDFHLNTTTFQFDYAKVTVENVGTEQASGTIYISLKDVTNNEIASGEEGTGLIDGGATNTPVVTLVWVSGKNITHYDHGSVLITQTP